MRTRREEEHSARRMVQTATVGIGIGVLMAVVWLLLAAVLMTWVDLPPAAISPISIAALGLGALAAGYVAARRIGKNGLLLGAVCGLGLFLITLIAGLASFGSVQTGFALFKLAVSVLCGAIGGVLGVGR